MRDRNIQRSDHWATPAYIYNRLDKEFHFDFDPCPYMHNIRLWDGLEIEWGQRNFCNPPYNFVVKTKFILKAVKESQKGKLVVLLLPVSTSTRLFHEVILENISEPVRFVKRRIRFVGEKFNGETTSTGSPMHDSMIVIFGASPLTTRISEEDFQLTLYSQVFAWPLQRR